MVSFVDVQQGDGAVIETPKGKVILVDGGENQLFARYLAARYSGTSLLEPKKIDCIVVSHGDADHFEGLPRIMESESHKEPRKRLFINPDRVYHNGIVKGPSRKNNKQVKDTELLGATVTSGDQLYITGLADDLLNVPDEQLNTPFRAWKKTLTEYKKRNDGLRIKRVDFKSKNQFLFLHDEDIKIDILGPISEEVNGNPALKFLREPHKLIEMDETKKSGSYSASHTINGHSVILKMKYGNVRFLFSGDLNREAEDILVDTIKNNEPVLKAEVLKVPHHGSADFSSRFFEAVNPLVSVVSSGDENEQKEYIHPRATLMGVLGKHSRIDRSLVFVTELVAFFKTEGPAKLISGKSKGKNIYAFSRTAYGIVHIRTDGKRLLVFTHSGQKDLKEAYAYDIAADGTPTRKLVDIG